MYILTWKSDNNLVSVPVPKKENKYTHIEVVLSCFFLFFLPLSIRAGHLLLYLLLRIYEVVVCQTVKLSLRQNLLCFKYLISVLLVYSIWEHIFCTLF